MMQVSIHYHRIIKSSDIICWSESNWAASTVHTFLIIGSSVVVTLWKILFTPAKATSFFVVTRS